MLRVSKKGLEEMEANYQGITEQIMDFENAGLPSDTRSEDVKE